MAAQAGQKLAFSLSPEGHEQDAADYRRFADYLDETQDITADYAKRAKIRGLMLNHPLVNALIELDKRHYAHAASLHDKEQNAYNPLGGLLTPYHRKQAFALTPEGHEYDARINRAGAEMLGDVQANLDKYRRKAKLRGLATADPANDIVGELVRRHLLYTAKKHEKGENAYNPFGGMASDDGE